MFDENKLNNINWDSKILIIGDIICDYYVYGNSNRLSPEADVPIFVPQKHSIYLGGAANVYNIINSIIGSAKLCGIVGNDEKGNLIKQRLSELNGFSNLIVSGDRPTTTKIRLILDKQHLLRIDKEDTLDIDCAVEDKIITQIEKSANDYDVLILSDYHKGFLSSSLVKKIIRIFNSKNIKILVDVKKDFLKYKNAFLIKPNIKDLANIVGDSIFSNRRILIDYCKELLYKGNFQYIYVTMGDKGGLLIDKNNVILIPSVFCGSFVDATGAGDAAIAALAVAIASKLDIVESVHFASYVAGISVTKKETCVITKEELFKYVGRI